MHKINSSFNPDKLKKLAASKGFQHPDYGDLLKPDSVTMSVSETGNLLYCEYNPYFIHLSVTNRCNANCRGCVNSEITDKNFRNTISEETNPERDAAAINKIISGIKDDIVICFYGGEPLLRPEKIQRLIELINEKSDRTNIKYMLYTNGSLLGNLLYEFKDVIEKLWLISISIDGSKKQHEKFRTGTDLDLIRQNMERVKQSASINMLMWSTLREEQSLLDCYQEFKQLYHQGSVDYFFWHWVEAKEPFKDFPRFIIRYERELNLLMKEYVAMLKDENIVLPITHINELLLYLFTGKNRRTTSCAVEKKRNYDIVGGKIYACADLPRDFLIGTIDNNGQPKMLDSDLNALVEYKKYLGCYKCGVGSYCGGRCPVQALTSTEQRLIEYCQLMRLHVGTVKKHAGKIKQIMEKRHYSLQDVYDRSVFINQLTDVTP